MAEKGLLEKYHEKRDFDISSEPFGSENSEGGTKKPIFVIQKHDASNLHYDFRLLVSGVLKSWAVPKGPSTDPDEKRLAIRTEDHPLEYADFEGGIPEDQYGGGTVMVWDAGTYKSQKTDKKGNSIPMEKQLEKGRATVILEGKKLKGAYSLIRLKKGKTENWLLKKVKDSDADARRNPTSTEKNSVLTGRSMEEIRKDSEKNG
ncbi:DNA polymerase ligase N-terminal domain-containing protein [Salegentibacter sp. F188]|uniref:DNA polymerase ligase N-terminal domain-containing protein n=1 Tax=Autumnicola patrickiae TaxID=3075591 RepID=A0ABU3E675_9FLAO|nr:DNA polymerase ligase N-terminal domain-containing protein [Salegentibacter sp. F188]MDT0691489.1 DNA polymerase ligase N-terminal domain-containing protein [Salegentibacter sp. F188]